MTQECNSFAKYALMHHVYGFADIETTLDRNDMDRIIKL